MERLPAERVAARSRPDAGSAAAPPSRRPGTAAILILGVLSEAIYFWLARFDALNGAPVFAFLLAFLLLFVIYGVGASLECGSLRPLFRTATGDRHGRSLSDTKGRTGTEGKPEHRQDACATSAPRPTPILFILAFGLLFRLTLIPSGLRTDLPLAGTLLQDLRGDEVGYDPYLLYDQDVWRYLWEGRVWASGYDPFQFAPENPDLDRIVEGPRQEVWEEIRDRVTYPELASIYPPLAQLLFRASHWTFPGSVAGFKLWLIGLECLAAWLLFLSSRRLGIRPGPTLYLYAWNPLAVKAFAGSAHFDALVVLCLSLLVYGVAAGRSLLSYASLAAAGLAKFVPVVLFTLVSPWRWLGIVVAGLIGLAGLAPFWQGYTSRFLETGAVFASDWRFNAAPFHLLEWWTGSGALFLYAALLAALAILLRGWSSAAPLRQLTAMLWLLGLAITLGPVVHPWYLTWLLPMACLVRDRVWLFFSGLVFMAFFVMFDGIERQWVVALEYIILGIVVWADPFWKRRIE